MFWVCITAIRIFVEKVIVEFWREQNFALSKLWGVSMDEITKDEMRERMENIELIRDIIFGSKLKEYDSRIDRLESKSEAIQTFVRLGGFNSVCDREAFPKGKLAKFRVAAISKIL